MKTKFLSAIPAVFFILLMPVLSFGEELDGARLYQQHCAGCHYTLSQSLKAGRRAERIESAIKVNIGGMGRCKNLKPKELEAIADALAKVAQPNQRLLNGGELYKVFCSECHKDMDKSDLKARVSGNITAAMEKCRMPKKDILSSEEYKKISEVITIRSAAP